jgi:plastocyanin
MKLIYISLILIILTLIYSCNIKEELNHEIIISNNQFIPSSITIQKGDSIRWINRDNITHSIYNTEFDSKILKKYEEFKQSFHKSGKYEYICQIHPNLKGSIIVLN